MGAIKSKTLDENDTNYLGDQKLSNNNNQNNKRLIKSSSISSISSSSIIQPTSTSTSDKEEYIIVVNDISSNEGNDIKKLSSQSEKKIKNSSDEINNFKNSKQFKKDAERGKEEVDNKNKMFRNASSTNYFGHNHVATASQPQTSTSKNLQFTSFQPPTILQKSQYFRSFRSASRRLFGSNANTSKPNSGTTGASAKPSTEYENGLDQDESFVNHNNNNNTTKSPYLNNLFKRSFKDINALRNLNAKLRNDFNNQATSNIISNSSNSKSSGIIKIRQLKSKSNTVINLNSSSKLNQEQLNIPIKVIEEVEYYDNHDTVESDLIHDESLTSSPPPYTAITKQPESIKENDFIIKTNLRKDNKSVFRNSQKIKNILSKSNEINNSNNFNFNSNDIF